MKVPWKYSLINVFLLCFFIPLRLLPLPGVPSPCAELLQESSRCRPYFLFPHCCHRITSLYIFPLRFPHTPWSIKNFSGVPISRPSLTFFTGTQGLLKLDIICLSKLVFHNYHSSPRDLFLVTSVSLQNWDTILVINRVV